MSHDKRLHFKHPNGLHHRAQHANPHIVPAWLRPWAGS